MKDEPERMKDEVGTRTGAGHARFAFRFRFILHSSFFILLAVLLSGCGGPGEFASTARLVIDSSPESGAELSVGNVTYGVTPVMLEGIEAGELLVVLTKDRFKRTTHIVSVPRSGEETVTVELEALTGYLTLKSKPTCAAVYLDGARHLGETPLFHKPVAAGDHRYELRLANYKSVEAEITVEPDYRYTFTYELVPVEATLSIMSRPTGARVWLNDELQVDTTPAVIELSPGIYTVTAHAKGFIMGEQNVSLGPNENITVELQLKEGDAPPGMVLVPGGKFTMGSEEVPDERPVREVTIDAFYIDKHEVTNDDFKAVFSSHAYDADQGRFPVAGVTFNRACEYAEAVGKRLPTEEEWEKAARGTDGREFPWGNEFDKSLCTFKDGGREGLRPVGRHRGGVSPYACTDMAGNIYEWTSNWYKAYPGNTDVQKDYGQIFRVLRGGSYKQDRFGVRCARRHYDRMEEAQPDYGFRCAKDVECGP